MLNKFVDTWYSAEVSIVTVNFIVPNQFFFKSTLPVFSGNFKLPVFSGNSKLPVPIYLNKNDVASHSSLVEV